MRKLLPLLLLFSLACTLFTPRPTPAPTETAAPLLTATPQVITATPLPTATPFPTVAFAPTPARSYHLRLSDVTLHPGPPLYSGDIVSLEIDAVNADPAWQDAPVSLFVSSREARPIAVVQFGRFGIGGRAQATFTWAWDTQGLEGLQTLTVTVGRADESPPLDVLTLTVNLLPADRRPLPEALARWARSESACCVFHYLTHTAAARDLALIEAEADTAMVHVENLLGVKRREKIDFTLLSRLLGHGGFANDEISMTYLDRNPAGNNLSTVFAHEMTHMLDRQIGDQRPTFMTEGLAVYAAGGHFKPEDLDQRAAALLALGGYIPLDQLAEDFYPAQHEMGYLEAGAFVKYLVDTYGWERFKAFYASFEENPSQRQMLASAVQTHFDRRLNDIEADWLKHLRSLSPSPTQIADLRLTITLYDTLRRYQRADDPSAYFLTAWLPDGSQARRRGITADFVRRPTAPENIALEAMLTDAQRALVAGEFAAVETLLASVNNVLDANNLFNDPLAADYLQIVASLSAQGYEVQTITLDQRTATVTAIRAWPELETFTLARTATGWGFAPMPLVGLETVYNLRSSVISDQ